MREGLENHLQQYNKVAKRSLEFYDTRTNQKERREFKNQLDTDLEQLFHEITSEAVEGKPLSRKAANRVYQLQVQKQQIMEHLHADLRNVDEGSYESPVQTRYVVRGDTDGLVVAISDNESIPISLGEIIAGEDWGVEFNINSSNCSRQVMKRWLVERAKGQLRQLLNWQIIEDASANGHLHQAEAMSLVADNQDYIDNKLLSKDIELDSSELGIFAERFVRNFLVKLSIDFDLDFEVLDADVAQDAFNKLDLIIKKKQHVRDVRIEESSKSTDKYGLQITVSQQQNILDKKSRAVDQSKIELKKRGAVRDLALVQISPHITKQIGQGIKEWSISKHPKGPDFALPIALREQLFKELLQGMFTKEELDEQWAKVVGESGDKESMRQDVEGVEPILLDRSKAHPILPEIIRHEDSAEAAD